MREESLLPADLDEKTPLVPTLTRLNKKGLCVKYTMTALGLFAYAGEFLFSKFTQQSVYLGLKEVHRVLSGDYPDDATDDFYNGLSYVLAGMDYVTNISLIDLNDGVRKFLQQFPSLFIGGKSETHPRPSLSFGLCLQVLLFSVLPRLAMFINYTTGGLTSCIPLAHWLKDSSPVLRYTLMGLTVASTIDYYLIFSYVDVLESANKFRHFRQSAMYRLWCFSKSNFLQRFIQSFIITNTFRFSTFGFVGETAAEDVFAWPEGKIFMLIACGLGAWVVSALTRTERLFEKSIKPLYAFNNDKIKLQHARYDFQARMRVCEKVWVGVLASKFALIRGLAYGGITMITTKSLGALPSSIMTVFVGLFLFYQSFSSDWQYELNCRVAKYHLKVSSRKKYFHIEEKKDEVVTRKNCIERAAPYIAGCFNTVSQIDRGFSGFLFMWSIFHRLIPDETVVFLMVVAIALELGITNGSYFQPKAEKVIKGWLYTLFGRFITDDPIINEQRQTNLPPI